MNNDIQTTIGTAFYDFFGPYCQELVDAGYDLDDYYSAGDRWGDFSRVLVKVAQLRGALSYDDYVAFFEQVKPADHKVASKQLFARITGIYTPRVNNTQTDRTRTYRQRQAQELRDLRELNALKWIEDNPKQAQEFINKITSVK